jgi:hypothetical protein
MALLWALNRLLLALLTALIDYHQASELSCDE